MKINITEDHVEKAKHDLKDSKRGLGYYCPVSQCLKEMFSSVECIVTGIDTLIIHYTEYFMDNKLINAVETFDIHGTFPIGEYEITPKTLKTLITSERSEEVINVGN